MRKIKKEKQYINFNFDLWGQHHYPGHPTLKVPHIHKFGMNVMLETFTDRGIEFIEFRTDVKQTMLNRYNLATQYSRQQGPHHMMLTVLDFGDKSCETLCEELARTVAEQLPADYPEAELQVLVIETEENASGIWKGKVLAAEG